MPVKLQNYHWRKEPTTNYSVECLSVIPQTSAEIVWIPPGPPLRFQGNLPSCPPLKLVRLCRSSGLCSRTASRP